MTSGVDKSKSHSHNNNNGKQKDLWDTKVNEIRILLLDLSSFFGSLRTMFRNVQGYQIVAIEQH